MKFLCNIVNMDKNHIKTLQPTITSNINFCENVSQVIKNIPTLYVGFNFLEENSIYFNPIKKEIIKNKVFWTYGKEEKYIDFINDTKDFLNKYRTYYWKSLDKTYIDPIFNNIKTNQELNNLISKIEIKKNVLKKDKLFIFDKNDKLYIFHIPTFDYFNLKLPIKDKSLPNIGKPLQQS